MSKFIVWVNTPSASNVVNSETLYADSQAKSGFASGTAASSTRVNSMLRQSSLVLAAILKSLNFDLSDMPFDLSSNIDTAVSSISNTNLFKINECLRYSTTGNNIDTLDTDKPYVRIGSVTTNKFGFSGTFNGDAYLTSLRAYDNNINVYNTLLPQSSSINIGSASSRWPYIYATNVYSTYFIAHSQISSPKIISGSVDISDNSIKIANNTVALHFHDITIRAYNASDEIVASICFSLPLQSSSPLTTWNAVALEIVRRYTNTSDRCSATGYFENRLVIGITGLSSSSIYLITIPTNTLSNPSENLVQVNFSSYSDLSITDKVSTFFG